MPEVYQRSEQPNEEGVALKACLRSAQGCGNCCLWRSEAILSLEHRGHQWQDAFQSSSGRLTWHGMLSRAAGYGVVPLLGGSSDAVTRVMTPTKQRCTARRVFNLGSDGRLASVRRLGLANPEDSVPDARSRAGGAGAGDRPFDVGEGERIGQGGIGTARGGGGRERGIEGGDDQLRAMQMGANANHG